MRMLVVVGLVVLAAGAALVPLPLRLVSPGVLVEVGDAVTLELGGAVAEAQTLSGDVSGSYLVVEQPDDAPTAARVAAAIVDPKVDVRAGAPAPQPGVRHPLTDAALAAVGAMAARSPADELPVVATAREGTRADPRSLALVLHVFDTLADVDLAAGRRIAVLGIVEGDGAVSCPARVRRSAEAARDAGVDVLVVPRACDEDGDAGEDVPVLRVGSFTEAVVVLRDGPGPPAEGARS